MASVLSGLHSLSMLLAALLMLGAAASDVARYRIPNLACLGLILLFPLFAATRQPALPWLEHLAVFALVLGVGYLAYIRHLAGAGDVKFLASIALWAGPAFVAPFLLTTALAGGALSLGIGIKTLIRQKRGGASIDTGALRRTPVPYGLAIALGGICTLALLSHPELSAAGG